MQNVIDITAVIDTDKDLRKLYKLIPDTVYLTIYDARYLADKKKAWVLKNEYGAQENPFIEVKINGQFTKMFYKEASEDPIQDLINYLNEQVN